MRTRFLETLEAYKAGLEQAPPRPVNPLTATAAAKPRNKWFAWWPAQPALQMALAAALLLGGVLVGRWQAAPHQASPEIAALQTQVEGLRQMVSMSLLQQQSAGDRLRGVSFSEQVAQPDAELEKQLLHLLTHDPNVNVRLSVVDDMQKFSTKPEVRRALVDAIPMQESPLVQTAIIDLLTQWSDRNALGTLRELSKNDRTDPIVRQRATLAVQKLETSK
jgi:hypothetical protein